MNLIQEPNKLLRSLINQFNQMGIMLIAKFRNTLPKDVTY